MFRDGKRAEGRTDGGKEEGREKDPLLLLRPPPPWISPSFSGPLPSSFSTVLRADLSSSSFISRLEGRESESLARFQGLLCVAGHESGCSRGDSTSHRVGMVHGKGHPLAEKGKHCRSYLPFEGIDSLEESRRRLWPIHSVAACPVLSASVGRLSAGDEAWRIDVDRAGSGGSDPELQKRSREFAGTSNLS